MRDPLSDARSYTGSRCFVARRTAVQHGGRNGGSVLGRITSLGTVGRKGLHVNLLVVQEEPPVASFIKRGLEAEGFRRPHRVRRRRRPGDVEIVRSRPHRLGSRPSDGDRGGDPHQVARRRFVGAGDRAHRERCGPRPGGDPERRGRRLRDEARSFSELLARIRARLRAADQTISTTMSHGRVTVDLTTRDVRIGGRSVDLTPREFALLETLMRHAGQVLSQAQLLDQVWGYDRGPTSNVVEVYVGYLRKKLRRDVVETIRGAGYRFRG
jgi:Transcriptional regulatory protein, C terminal